MANVDLNIKQLLVLTENGVMPQDDLKVHLETMSKNALIEYILDGVEDFSDNEEGNDQQDEDTDQQELKDEEY